MKRRSREWAFAFVVILLSVACATPPHVKEPSIFNPWRYSVLLAPELDPIGSGSTSWTRCSWDGYEWTAQACWGRGCGDRRLSVACCTW